MNTDDIRAELLNIITGDVYTSLEASESADHDNLIILTDDNGDRYKLEITKL